MERRGIGRCLGALNVGMFFVLAGRLITSAALAETPVEQQVDAIAAGVNTWLANLRLYCTFEEWHGGQAANFEEAVAGRYTVEPTLWLRGICALDGDLICHMVEPVNPKAIFHQAMRNRKTNVMVSWSYGTVDVRIWRPALQEDLPHDAPTADYDHNYVHFPWVEFGQARQRNWLARLRQEQKKGMPISFQVEKRDKNRLLVTAIRHVYDGSRCDCDRVYFKIDRGLPLLERIEAYRPYDSSDESKSRVLYMYLLENFVDVKGGKVASQVRSLYPLADGRVGLRVWRSADLGRRPPTPADFVMRVPADVPVICLKKTSMPPVQSGYRHLDITRLTINDIRPECGGGSAPGEVRPPRRSLWARWWLWVSVAAVLASVTLYVSYRIRQH